MIAAGLAAESPSQIVASGALPLAMFFAALAGVVSFASPCVLPLVPGFLAYVTGLTDERRRTRLVLGACLFVLGFSVVFVGIQAALGFAVDALNPNRAVLTRVGGVLVILMGLLFAGVFGQRGFTVRWRPAAGLLTAPLLGAVFALGMSPCIGPVFGAILSLNTSLASSGTSGRGVALMTMYSIGMGLPFILIAAGWSRAEKASRWLRDHHRAIQLIGGALMVLIGVLMVSGVWDAVLARIQTDLVNQTGAVI